MKLQVVRTQFGKDATNGLLYIDGIFECYTLADVVTEVSYESFIENPIETFVDFDNLGDITIANIGDDMTNDQKEKAQEVVVPVILTRIASMAAFMFRRS